MKVKQALQLSVYLENRVGALTELCRLIAEHSVSLFGICVIDEGCVPNIRWSRLAVESLPKQWYPSFVCK